MRSVHATTRATPSRAPLFCEVMAERAWTGPDTTATDLLERVGAMSIDPAGESGMIPAWERNADC